MAFIGMHEKGFQGFFQDLEDAERMQRKIRSWTWLCGIILFVIIFIRVVFLKIPPIESVEYQIVMKTEGLPQLYQDVTWYGRGWRDAFSFFTWSLAYTVVHHLGLLFLSIRPDKKSLSAGAWRIRMLVHSCAIFYVIFLTAKVPCTLSDYVWGYPEKAIPYYVKFFYRTFLPYWLSCIPLSYIFCSSTRLSKAEVKAFTGETVCMTVVLIGSYVMPVISLFFVYPVLMKSFCQMIYKTFQICGECKLNRQKLWDLYVLYRILEAVEKGVWAVYIILLIVCMPTAFLACIYG